MFGKMSKLYLYIVSLYNFLYVYLNVFCYKILQILLYSAVLFIVASCLIFNDDLCRPAAPPVILQT